MAQPRLSLRARVDQEAAETYGRLAEVRFSFLPMTRKPPTSDMHCARGYVRSRIAANVQRLRIGRGWTISELAERAELPPVVIAHLESGQVGDLGIDELWQVAEALGVDVYDLLTPLTAH